MIEFSEEEIKVELVTLLKHFNDFCIENDIEYFLAYGAMLGAVRHHGFIPWDNDIDIFIKRNQMNRIVALCEKGTLDIDDQYALCFRKYYSDKIISRIYFYDKTTEGEAGEDGGMGIYLDGFILDEIPSNIFIRLWKSFLERVLILKKRKINVKNMTAKEIVMLILKILTLLYPQEYVEMKFLALLAKSDNKSTDYSIMRTPYGVKKYPKKIFDEVLLMEYENSMLPIPIGYDEFLTITYGDYMTPLPPEKRTKQMVKVWKK